MRRSFFLLIPLQALVTLAVAFAELAPIEPAAYTINGLPPGRPGTSAELTPVEPARKISKERAERVIIQGRQGRDANIKATEKWIKETQEKSSQVTQELRLKTQQLSEMRKDYRVSFPTIALRDCRVGDAGIAAKGKLKIISVVDGENVIAEYDDSTFHMAPRAVGYATYTTHHYIYLWLKGFKTTGLVDDVEVDVRCPIEVTGTTTYTTAGQSKSTILVLEPFIIERQEQQKVEAENKAVAEKAEADRMAETAAAEKAEADKRAAAEKAEADKRAAAEKAEADRKAAIEEARWHTWTDSTGQHKTKAMFGGMAGGKVKLIKKDGSTVRLPLEALSDEDRQWIKSKSR